MMSEPVSQDEFDRVVFGHNGTVGILESLRVINAWIIAYEARQVKADTARTWWQHDLVKMSGGAVLAILGALASHYLLR